ncbi:MAG TPA: subclass B3 metallo-beta-lactamase [Verrucomicrobiales bacterium]|nr:subclass B3 metallo-beta-lactamase [Verrucomicrobiales bacterium]
MRPASFNRSYPLLTFLALAIQLLSGLTTLRAATGDSQASSSSGEEVRWNPALPREWVAWNVRRKPFRLLGPIHYVGPAGVSSFLITTEAGHILLDTGFAATPPILRENITALGFKLTDIRYILSSHAHVDHVGGHALMKRWTGATVVASQADAALLASGGTNDYSGQELAVMGYPPIVADRVVRDGDTVTLGGVTLTCHLTPGHTRGCTSWTMEVADEGKTRHVLFFGSTTVLPGVRLVGNAQYPEIAEDLTRTYRTLLSLPCDVFLAPHASFFDLASRAERLAGAPGVNPFVDREFPRSFLASAEQRFLEQLARERTAAAK